MKQRPNGTPSRADLFEALDVVLNFVEAFDGECATRQGYCEAHLDEQDCSVKRGRELLARHGYLYGDEA